MAIRCCDPIREDHKTLSNKGIQGLTIEIFSELPAELLTELRQAILELDREAMTSIIELIDDYTPETEQALQTLV